MLLCPIYCKRSLENERNIGKKETREHQYIKRLIPLPLLSFHLTARETEKNGRNTQKPATALGRQINRKERIWANKCDN